MPVTLAILGMGACAGLAWAELEGHAARGAQAVAVCAACHQSDGSGIQIPGGESWPRLAGLDAGYISRQLHDYNSGNRINETMAPFAAMLNEQQIADVAAYYSEMTPTAGKGGEGASEAELKRGEQLALRGDWSIYMVSCKSCHGPDNQGAGSIFPAIAGQHAGYIESQLKAWKAETRRNDPNDLMGSIARRMSDEDIRAVAVWLARQNSGAN